MDLAATFGQPGYRSLARSMTEGEFYDWQVYANRKMLPFRRLEFGLARIAMLIAQTMGGAKNQRLEDYLFDPEDTSEPTVDDEVAFFDFQPRDRKTEADA